MADDSTVLVKFGAEISDLTSKIGEVQDLFKGLIASFGGIAAAIGGGELFAKFVDAAQDATRETVKLAQAMGTSGDDAAALKVALEEVGSNADAYSGAFLKFSRQLATNGDTLKQYGIDVDGVRNGTVSGAEAFQQALKSVASYKVGIDQNQASQKLFGRGITDVHALLRLTPELLDEAKKKVDDLNLSVSQESVDASHKYVAAMADVKDVVTGVEKTIGEALIPVFTESAEKFASFGPSLVEGARAAGDFFVTIFGEMRTIVADAIGAISDSITGLLAPLQAVFGTEGPGAMQIFKNALGVVEAVFIGFRVGFEEVLNAIKTGLAVLANSFSTFASAAERILHFDFSGAQAEWKAGTDRQNEILQAGFAKAVTIATKGAADLDKALQAGTDGTAKPKTTPFVPTGGSKNFTPVDKSADAKASAERALLKAQEEAKLALIKEGITETQAAVDDAYKQGLLSTKEYFDETLNLQLQSTDAQLNAKRKELADTQALESKAVKPEAKLKFQAQEAQLAGQINVLESQRNEEIVKNANAYRDAERQRLDALAAFQAAEQKAGADDEVAKEKQALDQEKALRQISADDAFAIEKRLEDQSYQALVDSLIAKAAAVRGSEDDQAKQQQAIALEAEAAFRDHQNKLTTINNAAEQERSKYSIQAQQETQQAFSTMIGSYLQGVTSMSNALRQFAVSVGNTFANLVAQKFTDKLFDVTGVNQAINKMVSFVTEGIAKMVTKWLGGEAANTAATQSGTLARIASGETQSAAETARLAAQSAAVITSEGAQTAAAVSGDATVAASDATSTATAIAAQQTQSVAAILGYSAEAAVAAMASVAAIPFVGWALAPEVGAATYAEGLAYLASAAGGWDQVPSDQIAQVHKDEMVLSAPIAGGLRDLISRGGQGNAFPTDLPGSVHAVAQTTASARPSAAQISTAQQGASSAAPVNPTFNITTMDAKGVKEFFNTHGKAIAQSLQSQGRNFVQVKPT